jgi:hypothetical protein
MKSKILGFLIMGLLGLTGLSAPAAVMAATTEYSFNFSTGGSGTLVYNTSTGVANPITIDFGVLGRITTDFGASSTASIFGAPPQEAVRLDGVFFPLRRTGESTNYSAVRLYINGTFCVRLLPENFSLPCVVSGTYRLAPPPPPAALSGTYDFNFSGAGTGFFNYDAVTKSIDVLQLNFGAYGATSTDFDANLTSLVFGNLLSTALKQDNTFFALNGGSAYGLRLRSNGTFCVRPDADVCGTGDLFSGTYSLARVAPGSLGTGSGVVAAPIVVDGNGQPVTNPPEVVLTFSEVSAAGQVTVTLLPEGSTSTPAVPFGFALAGATVVYDISTTGTFSGPVRVCLPYTDAGVAESALRLMHQFEPGSWEDITDPGSPDTTNNVICGTTLSFSPFATVVETDSDSDGLLDRLEQRLGTNPALADTDADGLSDGTEVLVTGNEVTYVTNPLRADTDGDGLSDGQEVITLGTNPSNADTDGDGVPDGQDPTPRTPGVPGSFIESELRRLATVALAYPLSVMDAPNDNARKGRRNALASQLMDAANLVAIGNITQAHAALNSLLDKLDGTSSPPDWMQAGPDKTDLHNDLVLLNGLLLQVTN